VALAVTYLSGCIHLAGMETPDSVLVKAAFASHLGGPAESFDETQHLVHDLALEPLDLVLISLELERAVGFEFPVASLEDAQTVGDVSAVVRGWLNILPVVRHAATRFRTEGRGKARARARSRKWRKVSARRSAP
jgi:acyl carrier protein